MGRRGLAILPWVVSIAAVMIGIGVSVRAARGTGDSAGAALAQPAGMALVSLSPPLTETLVALGVGEYVVAMSDFCQETADKKDVPRAGTAIAPNYETIARAQPSLILTEAGLSDTTRLGHLAPTLAIRWLDRTDVEKGIIEIGRALKRLPEAERAAAEFARILAPRLPPAVHDVLLVVGSDPNLTRVYFARRNSVHGAALEAAGASNAVRESVSGVPTLTVEDLLRVDPWAVIILAKPTDPPDRALRGPWLRLSPLQAARSGRISIVRGDDVFSTGPLVAGLVARLGRAVDDLRDHSAGRR